MLEQYMESAISALIIYAVGFIVFLPFNYFMVRKNRDSTEAAMGDGKFQFTTKECVLISVLWPLCVIGLLLLTIGAVYRFFGRIFQPRSKPQSISMKKIAKIITWLFILYILGMIALALIPTLQS